MSVDVQHNECNFWLGWPAGRTRDGDLRARYWAFLFDNLNRAVDEIYQNCEKDESIVECKEAIMVLQNYTREFQALIQWLDLNINYESTPPPNRPTSLTWEVRKSMPKQMTLWNTFFNKNGIFLFYQKIMIVFSINSFHININWYKHSFIDNFLIKFIKHLLF